MKRNLLLLLATCLSLSVFAQSSYYNNTNISLTGNNLFEELSDLVINTHTTELSYTPGVWEALKVADQNPSNSSQVILVYGYNDTDSDIVNDRTRGIDNNGGNTTDWNREHVFPKSLANPNLGTTGPGADAHHIRPSDVSMNSNRSNRLFADGSGNAGTTSAGYWYPGDEWKGDVARMMLYMYLRYEDRCLPTAVGVGSTMSSDSNMIDLFLDWNVEDPVSSLEVQRNNAIENIQGNRNPFIDNPAFATSIWGGDQAEDLFGTGSGSSGGENDSSQSELIISEYVEGSSYNKAIEIANISNGSVNLSSYSLKRNTNGGTSWSTALNLSGTLASGDVYVIAHSYASSLINEDLSTTSTVMIFNGNDPIGLFYNDTLVDIVGTFGGGSSTWFGYNETLVRDTNSSASTTYNSSEWTSYDSNTFDFLGNYSSAGGGSSSSNANQLYISEYVEGSSNNKVIEIANYTGTSVNLSNYSLKRDTNGSGVWSAAYTLSGTLSNGNVIVVANSSASVSGDLETTSTVMTFNGNDPVGLFYNNSLIDIVGTFGGGSANFAVNTTLVRNSSVNNPSTSYNSSEWTSYSTDTFSFLGSHNTSAKSIVNKKKITEINVFPNPTSTYLNITGYENQEYIIYNILGTEVKSGIILNSKIELNTLASGKYFISIISENETITKRFLKQ